MRQYIGHDLFYSSKGSLSDGDPGVQKRKRRSFKIFKQGGMKMNRGKKGLRSFLQKMQRRFLPVFLSSLVMVIGYVPTNVGTVAVWAESGGAEASGDNGQPAPAASVPDVQSGGRRQRRNRNRSQWRRLRRSRNRSQ